MQIDLRSKRVLVTGGSGGIDSAMMRAFSRAGVQVAVNDVGTDVAADALVAEIGQDRAFATRLRFAASASLTRSRPWP